MFGEDHNDTLRTLNNLGTVYQRLGNCEKALKNYERALKGKEGLMGKNRPDTLDTVMNIANVYAGDLKDYGKAEELYERVLEGFEA